MKFNTVQDAFNYYRTQPADVIEKRAAEIKATIENDPAADVDSLNVEVQGMKQAKENAEHKQQVMKRSADLLSSVAFGNNKKPEDKPADILATPEYRNAFFKVLKGDNDLTPAERDAFDTMRKEKRAANFSTTSDMAAVIPSQTLNEIVTKAQDMGGIMGIARAFAVPSNLAVPVATPAAAAEWHTEGAEVTGDKPAITNVEFANHEIMKVFSISASVKRMALPAFESYLTQELTNSIMACIATSLVSGTGKNQGTGIMSAFGDSNTVKAASTGITYADVVKAVAKLKRGYSAGAKWVMNNSTLYNTFYGMVDGNKRPIFIADTQNDGIGKILGYEVVVDDFVADDVAIFGNFSYMAYNMADGIAVESSTQSSFKSGLVDYRAMAIADTKPIVTDAFVELTKATA
jgi:HK97 family phage major capsid protein